MTPSTLPRSELAKLFPTNPRAVLHFDEQQKQLANNTSAIETGVAATQGLNEATVLTLSPNDAFANERVLSLGDGLSFADGGPGADFVLLLTYLIVLNGGYDCVFNLLADTNLTLPSQGTVLSDQDGGTLINAVNDAAAATAGVPLNGIYRNGSALMQRQV